MSDLTEAEVLRRELVSEKHAQARALQEAHGIDCWLTFTREGSDLLLPFLTGNDTIFGTSALMLFSDGPSVAVVADYDVSQVEGLFDQVHAYSLDWQTPLQDILRDRKPERIGLNFSASDFGVDGLTYGLFQALSAVLEPLGFADRVVSAQPVAEFVRALKTPAEIERLRRAGAVTSRIFDDLTGMLRPGLTESDVAEILRERCQTYEVELAWDPAFCPAVATSASDFGHTAPGTARLEPGDGLRVDFGVRYEGYVSDLQRTWYVLKPGETTAPERFTHPFDAVRDGIVLAMELLKPGMIGYEVDRPVRDLVASRGYRFTHALGHQLGRLVHDGGMVLGPDNVRYGDRSGGVVQAGMVFTIEPCVDVIALEEDVVVTEQGCEYLTPPQRELILL